MWSLVIEEFTWGGEKKDCYCLMCENTLSTASFQVNRSWASPSDRDIQLLIKHLFCSVRCGCFYDDFFLGLLQQTKVHTWWTWIFFRLFLSSWNNFLRQISYYSFKPHMKLVLSLNILIMGCSQLEHSDGSYKMTITLVFWDIFMRIERGKPSYERRETM